MKTGIAGCWPLSHAQVGDLLGLAGLVDFGQGGAGKPLRALAIYARRRTAFACAGGDAGAAGRAIAVVLAGAAGPAGTRVGIAGCVGAAGIADSGAGRRAGTALGQQAQHGQAS